ncbi:MAG TPA: efflux RND transporter periplasmic adaptor subunit [Vicinamibacteria bacterium]|nr:efflux RND transporter periplasmic adaptor subunit [Vicinamibacteria bacterium]
MTRKVVFRAGLVLLVVALGFGVRQFAFSSPAPSFRFVTVERGDIQSTVSTTGTLGAVTTVNVGTQVSGQVSALYVDFNDEVKKGQLLARIDPTIAQQAVADAQANLERLRAQTNQAARDQDRNRELAAAGLIPASQAEQGEAALKVAQASEKSAQIALSRAQQGLSYTNIHAPIDGVVVERNVNLGQTVAASLSAPQLFLIANDLTQMRILAQVGESDIDKIQQGQKVRFTVQAIPDRTFEGTVQQVRLQSTMVDNVVNYTVVITLENPKRELLPGMTARVDFLVKASTGVLKVSNAALRYKPSEELLAQFGASPTPAASPRDPGRPSSGVDAAAPGAFRREARNGASNARPPSGTLYLLDASGRLESVRVQTGLTDGSFTEIQGRDVSEGMKVIAGLAPAAAAASKPAANPLSPTPQNRRGPQGGGGPF